MQDERTLLINHHVEQPWWQADESCGPVRYDANLQADEGVRVPSRPIAGEVGAGEWEHAVETVQGANG